VKKLTKKLTLSRSTIRTLSLADVHVAGGISRILCNSKDVACPTPTQDGNLITCANYSVDVPCRTDAC
jgi:hypothetical protein